MADGRFSTLVAAVQAADLAEALSGGEWTVFAPTDDAFARLGLNADNVADAFTTEELTDILLYNRMTGEPTTEYLKEKTSWPTNKPGGLSSLSNNQINPILRGHSS